MATTIPVTIEADAAARVAALGMQSEFDQMIEHAKQALPGLRFIRVTLEYDPVRPEDDPGVVLWSVRDDLAPGVKDKTDWDFGGWKVATFPPEVCRQFTMISLYGDAHGW